MATFIPNRGALPALAATPQMQHAMVEAAERGKTWAERNSPRRTGEYASSFVVEPAMIDGTAGARLVNTSDHAVYVEWANGTHVLARSVDAIEGGLT